MKRVFAIMLILGLLFTTNLGNTTMAEVPSDKDIDGLAERVDIQWGSAGEADVEGTNPASVKMPDGETVIRIYNDKDEKNLFYSVGKFDGTSIEWNRPHRYDTGKNAALTVVEGSDGEIRIVEIHEAVKEAQDYRLFYNIGKLEGDKIKWQNNGQWQDTAKGRQYDKGQEPTLVTIGDRIIDIHREDYVRGVKLYYNVGKLEGDSLKWQNNGQWQDTAKGRQYDKGAVPSATIVDDKIIDTHQGVTWNGYRTDSLYYNVGKLERDSLKWQNNGQWQDTAKGRQYGKGERPDIVALGDDTLIESHKSQNSDTLYYDSGKLEGNSLKWQNNGQWQDTAKERQYGIGQGRASLVVFGNMVSSIHVSQQDEKLWLRDQMGIVVFPKPVNVEATVVTDSMVFLKWEYPYPSGLDHEFIIVDGWCDVSPGSVYNGECEEYGTTKNNEIIITGLDYGEVYDFQVVPMHGGSPQRVSDIVTVLMTVGPLPENVLPSPDDFSHSHWMKKSVELVDTQYINSSKLKSTSNGGLVFQNIGIPRDKELSFTFSFWLKSERDPHKARIELQSDTGAPVSKVVDVTKDWQLVEVTYRGAGSFIRPMIYPGNETADSVYVFDPILEVIE